MPGIGRRGGGCLGCAVGHVDGPVGIDTGGKGIGGATGGTIKGRMPFGGAIWGRMGGAGSTPVDGTVGYGFCPGERRGLGDLADGGPQLENGPTSRDVRCPSAGAALFGCDLVNVTRIRCLRIAGIACLAKSADFPCTTRRVLCFKT